MSFVKFDQILQAHILYFISYFSLDAFFLEPFSWKFDFVWYQSWKTAEGFTRNSPNCRVLCIGNEACIEISSFDVNSRRLWWFTFRFNLHSSTSIEFSYFPVFHSLHCYFENFQKASIGIVWLSFGSEGTDRNISFFSLAYQIDGISNVEHWKRSYSTQNEWSLNWKWRCWWNHWLNFPNWLTFKAKPDTQTAVSSNHVTGMHTCRQFSVVVVLMIRRQENANNFLYTFLYEKYANDFIFPFFFTISCAIFPFFSLCFWCGKNVVASFIFHFKIKLHRPNACTKHRQRKKERKTSIMRCVRAYNNKQCTILFDEISSLSLIFCSPYSLLFFPLILRLQVFT